jgi:membrane dipeptidase
MPYNRFLQTGWNGGLNDNPVSVARVAAAADYICQRTGSAAHIGIGSDFDGGFGAESIPSPMDSVADLPLLPAALQTLGYTSQQAEQFAYHNWLNFLQKGLPK